MTTTTPVESGGGTNTVATPQPSTKTINPNSWEAQMLTAIGKASNINVPVTSTNVAIMDAWAKSEGTLWANNPFAISTPFPGATQCIAQCNGGNPIMAYATLQDGINATAQFIANGYTFIPKNLANSTPNDTAIQAATVAQGVFQAINQSGWCKNCQGGLYPIGIHQLINEFEKGMTPSQIGTVDKTSVTGIAGNYVSAAAKPVVGWVESLGKILGFLTNKNFWIRVGFGFLGFVMVMIGITLIVSETKTGQALGKAAAEGAILA